MSQFKDYLNKIQINESEKKEEDKKDLTSKEKADIAKNAQILSSITFAKFKKGNKILKLHDLIKEKFPINNRKNLDIKSFEQVAGDIIKQYDAIYLGTKNMDKSVVKENNLISKIIKQKNISIKIGKLYEIE
jgi:hypothetical protein